MLWRCQGPAPGRPGDGVLRYWKQTRAVSTRRFVRTANSNFASRGPTARAGSTRRTQKKENPTAGPLLPVPLAALGGREQHRLIG